MNHRQSLINSKIAEEEIGYKDLYTIANRFKKLHHFKRENIRRILKGGQRMFLDSLTLLLDVNHPALPGFIDFDTPSGIFGFQPDARALETARRFDPDYQYPALRRDHSKAAIDGLFLMGSVGSIAFTETSDMDVWVCHRSDLAALQVEALRKKFRALEAWAATLDLEVHFYSIDSREFLSSTKQPLSSNSCGETQHYLLLEEFYRTSVYLAGKTLAWWLVPPQHEKDYRNWLTRLQERQLIDPKQILDLGGLSHVPACEFISATQWHIFKALHSPYKSLLKLALLECYANDYPETDWLCVEIKRSVYRGKLTGLGVDPYVLIYRRLEKYLLASDNQDRLAEIRQFFYRKISESGSSGGHRLHRTHYGDYFREISPRWSDDADASGNGRTDADAWNFEKLLVENIRIISQLSLCYIKIIELLFDRIDSDFQQKHDMQLLSRKLSAFFKGKPGKIEMVATSQTDRPLLHRLAIVETQSASETLKWYLYDEKPSAFGEAVQTAIYRRQTLIEILAWLSLNRFYRPGLAIRCESRSLALSEENLAGMLDRLGLFFQTHFDFSDSLCNFASRNRLTHSLVIVNIGGAPNDSQTPEPALARPGNCFDVDAPLQSGKIQSIDRVSISLWNEVTTRHDEGMEGLCQCLLDIIHESRPSDNGDELTLVCPSEPEGSNLFRNILRLYRDLRILSQPQADDPAPRLVIQGDAGYIVFACRNGSIGFRRTEDEAQLLQLLSGSRSVYGSVRFGARVLEHTPIPSVYRQNRPQTVQCYLLEEAGDVRLFVLDENGSLFIRRHTDATAVQIANQYARFLNSLISRRITGAVSVQIFTIGKDASGGWIFRPVPLHFPLIREQHPLRLTCVMSSLDVITAFRWNGMEFSSSDYHERLFGTVCERIAEYRTRGQTYPVYITEVDLPHSQHRSPDSAVRQTLHFLELKQSIEAQLNGNLEEPETAQSLGSCPAKASD